MMRSRFVAGIYRGVWLAPWLIALFGATELDGSEPELAGTVEVRAARMEVPDSPAGVDLASARLLQQADHPLSAALRIALESYDRCQESILDYRCIFTRRERVDGELRTYEYMQAKVRHARTRQSGPEIPFSVYLHFLKPQSVVDREVLFVDGAYQGQMIVRNGGQRFAYVVTEVRPESRLAMKDNRYPITEFGFENLLRRLIEVAAEDIQNQTPCQVKFYDDAKINQRSCIGIQVVHPEPDPEARFHLARVFMDRELKVPLLYESYDWPREPGGQPQLLEQYSYSEVELNVGLTDVDFDRNHADYQLRQRKSDLAGDRN